MTTISQEEYQEMLDARYESYKPRILSKLKEGKTPKEIVKEMSAEGYKWINTDHISDAMDGK